VKIIVTRSLCSGHARCANVAPDLFGLNDEGYIELDEINVPAGQEELARRGVRACPERALRLADQDQPTPGEKTQAPAK
jgi:ferredoxin